MKSASMPECAFIHTCGLKPRATASRAAASGSLQGAGASYTSMRRSQYRRPPREDGGVQITIVK